jgi:DNA polymerase-3 subunit epsilon
VRELERAGLKWTAKKLCTVRAARKLDQDCFRGLGRLCDSLNINLDNRHRAGGDADTTAILFSRLLEWDTDKEMDKMIKKTTDQRLPPNLPKEDFEQLPDKTRVYYFMMSTIK